jgi:hypothetical protein
VVALFARVPPLDSPFDRILYGARRVIADVDPGASVSEPEARESVGSETWLAPWRGAPHPLSEIEQRLAAILSDDTELAALFRFNWFVDTVRGSRPKVDLVWIDGRRRLAARTHRLRPIARSVDRKLLAPAMIAQPTFRRHLDLPAHPRYWAHLGPW